MANEMTQQELADKTGVTRQTIVAIENGKYSPTLELSFRIAHVFNLPLEEVFDPTGAGDAFRSGFLAGYIRGLPLDTCGRLGSLTAAYTVESE